jgi:hypothetical protein
MEWERIYGVLFDKNATLAVIFLTGCIGLFVVAIVSRAVRYTGVYVGGFVVVIGSAWLAMHGNGITVKVASLSVSCLAVVGGALYLLVFLSLLLSKRREEKKRARAEEAKRLQYALPDKENSYLRARLNTVLKTPEEPNTEGKVSEKYFRLEHARKMLCGLREKSLAATERLEIDELRAILALYETKERLDAEELQVINDAFSRILKLSAKYEIALKGL